MDESRIGLRTVADEKSSRGHDLHMNQQSDEMDIPATLRNGGPTDLCVLQALVELTPGSNALVAQLPEERKIFIPCVDHVLHLVRIRHDMSIIPGKSQTASTLWPTYPWHVLMWLVESKIQLGTAIASTATSVRSLTIL